MREVPALADALGATAVELLRDGPFGAVWRIVTPDGELKLRHHPAPAAPAAGLGTASCVEQVLRTELAPDGSAWVVSRWVPGDVPSVPELFARHAGLLGRALARLHALDPPPPLPQARSDVPVCFTTSRAATDRLRGGLGELPPDLRGTVERDLDDLGEAVAAGFLERFEPVACHNDVRADNVVVSPDGRRAVLVDLEYARPGPRWLDLTGPALHEVLGHAGARRGWQWHAALLAAYREAGGRPDGGDPAVLAPRFARWNYLFQGFGVFVAATPPAAGARHRKLAQMRAVYAALGAGGPATAARGPRCRT